MEQEVAISNWVSDKSVSEYISEGKIVWIKSSNNEIHCGRVDENYAEKETVWVFNFDAWTHWIVDYKNIVRIGTSYYTDGYKNR